MTNIKVLIKKISEIEKYLQIVKRYRKYTQKEIKDNLDLKGAVERYLYLLCQATLDFADAIVSYSSFRTPSTYGETFEILEENEIINKDMVGKMRNMAGFRNILAHEYVKIKFEEVYRVLTKDIDDINKFLDEIKVKIKLE